MYSKTCEACSSVSHLPLLSEADKCIWSQKIRKRKRIHKKECKTQFRFRLLPLIQSNRILQDLRCHGILKPQETKSWLFKLNFNYKLKLALPVYVPTTPHLYLMKPSDSSWVYQRHKEVYLGSRAIHPDITSREHLTGTEVAIENLQQQIPSMLNCTIFLKIVNCCSPVRDLCGVIFRMQQRGKSSYIC